MERGHEGDVAPYGGADIPTPLISSVDRNKTEIGLSDDETAEMEMLAKRGLEGFKAASSADQPKYMIQAIFMARLYRDKIIQATTLTQVTLDYAPYAEPFEHMWLALWEKRS